MCSTFRIFAHKIVIFDKKGFTRVANVKEFIKQYAL